MSAFGIAAKAVRQNPVSVTGINGVVRASYMKVLPMELAVARKSAKYNRIGISLPNTDILEGEHVLSAGDWYIVANVSRDTHRGRPIRSISELVWCSHTDILVRRPVSVRDSNSGSIIGDTYTELAQNVKLLFTTFEMMDEGDRGVTVGYWNLYASKLYGQWPSETEFTIAGRRYEVDWCRDDMQGVYTYRVTKANR